MKAVLCLFVLVLATSSLAKPAIEKNERRKTAMYNPNLYQGDMKLTEDQLKAVSGDRNAVPTDYQRWPGGVIPYVIDSSLGSKGRDLVSQAMSYISRRTCITFKRRTTERNYIRVFNGDGCYSYWGFVNQGEQPLSLETDGCDYFGTVVHELLHTVGFDHEHSRYDRDDYINIYWDNIEKENHDQFNKHGRNEERRYTPFDYDSIMLYGSGAFAYRYGLTTMEKKDGGKLLEPYDKVYPTASDMKRVNMLYGCST